MSNNTRSRGQGMMQNTYTMCENGYEAVSATAAVAKKYLTTVTNLIGDCAVSQVHSPLLKHEGQSNLFNWCHRIITQLIEGMDVGAVAEASNNAPKGLLYAQLSTLLSSLIETVSQGKEGEELNRLFQEHYVPRMEEPLAALLTMRSEWKMTGLLQTYAKHNLNSKSELVALERMRMKEIAISLCIAVWKVFDTQITRVENATVESVADEIAQCKRHEKAYPLPSGVVEEHYLMAMKTLLCSLRSQFYALLVAVVTSALRTMNEYLENLQATLPTTSTTVSLISSSSSSDESQQGAAHVGFHVGRKIMCLGEILSCTEVIMTSISSSKTREVANCSHQSASTASESSQQGKVFSAPHLQEIPEWILQNAEINMSQTKLHLTAVIAHLTQGASV